MAEFDIATVRKSGLSKSREGQYLEFKRHRQDILSVAGPTFVVMEGVCRKFRFYESEYSFHDILKQDPEPGCLWFIRYADKRFNIYVARPCQEKGENVPVVRYMVWVNGLNYFLTNNPYFCLSTAFRHEKPIPQLVEDFRFFYSSKKSHPKATFDKEYNDIIGFKTESKTEDVVYEMPPPIRTEPVEPELYETFKVNFQRALSQRAARHTTVCKMGNAFIRADAVQPGNATALLLVTDRKKQHSPVEWLRLFNYQVSPWVQCLPKPGVVTSKGITRTVFQMTVSLEAALRLLFDGVDYTRLKGYVEPRLVWDDGLVYSYDLRASDELIGPYWLKLCEDLYPDLVDILYPKVVLDNGDLYRSKFPSGVLHTAFVTNLFTRSFMDRYQLDGVFQGDGMLLRHPFEHEALKSCPPGHLNGFLLGNFINHHKLVAPAYIRNQKPYGRSRYIIRYWAYLNMGADLESQDYPYPHWKLGLRTLENLDAEYICFYCHQKGWQLPSCIRRYLTIGGNFASNCLTNIFNEDQRVVVSVAKGELYQPLARIGRL